MPLASLPRRILRRAREPFRSLVRRATLLIAGAVLSAPAPAQDTVRLPPFIVQEPLLGPRWRLARVEGFEVLSRSSDRKATAMLEAYRTAFAKLEVLLPRRFVAAHDVPIKLIVYDESLWPRSTQEEVAAMLATLSDRVPTADLPDASDRRDTPFYNRLTRRPENHFDRLREPWITSQAVEIPYERDPPGGAQPQASVFFTDMRLTDLDEIVIFSLAPSGYHQRFSISLRSTFVAHLLGKRTPSLPPWFMRGFLEVYRDVTFDAHGLTLPALELETAEATAAARQNADPLTNTFVPTLDLLADVEVTDYTRRDRQLGLFVRWALDPDGGNRPEALWTLVDEACHQPVDEAALRRAFDQTSAEIDRALVAYAATALRDPVHWPQPTVNALPVSFESAHSADVARIKGDWERLETDWVRHNHRELEDHYAAKARKTLQRGGWRGDRDPRLLTVRGLFELEAGRPDAATELLEKALASDDPLRPRAYLALARLRFSRWQADNAGTDTPLSPATAAPWLDLLRRAQSASPQMLPVFHTYADIVTARQGQLTEADRVFLDRGAGAFPRDPRIALQRVQYWLQNGREDIALTIINRALAWDVIPHTDPAWQELIDQVSTPTEVAPRHFHRSSVRPKLHLPASKPPRHLHRSLN